MRKKPLIGLNADYRPAKKDSPAFTFVTAGYYDCITAVGGIPVILPPHAEEDDLDRILELLDGVVLVGGADLDPRNDGFMLHPSARLMDQRRETVRSPADAPRRQSPPAGVRHRLRHATHQRAARRQPASAHS